MNLVQVANEVRMLSDPQLQQMMQNPGAVPQYILAAELQRRQTTRAESTPPSQGTVVDSLMGKVNKQQERPTMPMQEALPQGMGQPNLRGMKAGGVVRMASGGKRPESDELKALSLDDILRYWAPPEKVQLPEQPVVSTQDYVAALLPKIAEMEERAKRYDDGALSRALMRSGAAMMASKDPTAFGGLGAGLASGLAGWDADKQQSTKDLQNMVQMRTLIAQEQQKAADALASRQAQMWGHEAGARVVDAQSINSYNMAKNRQLADLAEREADRPYRQSQVDMNRANIEHSAASLPYMQAQAEALKKSNAFENTPEAAWLVGFQTGDTRKMAAAKSLMDLEQRATMERLAVQMGPTWARAKTSGEEQWSERDQQFAVQHADKIMQSIKSSLQWQMKPESERLRLEPQLRRQYYMEGLQMVGRKPPATMGATQPASTPDLPTIGRIENGKFVAK